MLTTHRVAAALVAVALSACAHANTSSSSYASQSYLGGRAGQPHSFTPGNEARERARAQAWNEPRLGGRSAQPGSWISSSQETPSVDPNYCYLGGRDAQPFSGPNLRVQKTSHTTETCERSSSGARL